jgi:hypothetical protein
MPFSVMPFYGWAVIVVFFVVLAVVVARIVLEDRKYRKAAVNRRYDLPPIPPLPPIRPMPPAHHYVSGQLKSSTSSLPDLQRMLEDLKKLGVDTGELRGLMEEHTAMLEKEQEKELTEGKNIQECPQCGEQKRIPENDYICKECRG